MSLDALAALYQLAAERSRDRGREGRHNGYGSRPPTPDMLGMEHRKEAYEQRCQEAPEEDPQA
jgi:hypothetical protein